MARPPIESAAYCLYCGRRTRHVRPAGPRLVPNAFLALLTLGFWLPVWLLRAFLHGVRHPARCQDCGSPIGTDKARPRP